MILLFLVILQVCFAQQEPSAQSKAIEFSGFYTIDPKASSEDFAAAWLISKERFYQCEASIMGATNMAGVSFAVARNKKNGNFRPLLTRDYFDFFVEHMSSTSNQIPFGNKLVFNETYEKVIKTGSKLKQIALSSQKFIRDPRTSQTIGILVYSSNSFSAYKTPEQANARKYFFTTTYWSVYRYIKNIMIFVANQEDRAEVDEMGLKDYSITILPTPLDIKNRTVLLPQKSLLYVMGGLQKLDGVESLRDKKALENQNDQILDTVNYETQEESGAAGGVDPEHYWPQEIVDRLTGMKYIFFTEGDQVVHCRSFKALYDTIDASDGHFAMVPHRMQTLAMMKSYSPSLWRYWPAVHAQQHLKEVEITTESIVRPRGSCCDAGRHKYAKCRGWWYNCIDWGLRNFTTFFQFGKNGLVMPTSTEHQGVCEYTPERRLCDIPDDCKMRTPKRKTKEDFAAVSAAAEQEEEPVEQEDEEEQAAVQRAKAKKKKAAAAALSGNKGSSKYGESLEGQPAEGGGDEALEEDADPLPFSEKPRKRSRSGKRKKGSGRSRAAADDATARMDRRSLAASSKPPIDANTLCKEMPIIKYFGPMELM